MIDKTQRFIDDIQLINMKVKTMKNAKNTKNTTPAKFDGDVDAALKNAAPTTTVEKIMTVADVARELNIDPKRARAFLRKNVELYTMRKQKFTKTSKLYENAKNALIAYKQKNVVVTQ